MHCIYYNLFLIIPLCQIVLQCQSQQIACGVRLVRKKDLIVHGVSAKAHLWPWHATILHRSSFDTPPEYACGGSLISENFVLTARHCTLAVENGNTLTSAAIVVQFGVEMLYQINERVQQHNVLRIHTVQHFCCRELRNDIALLELRTVVQFNKFVLPVCLPDGNVNPGENGTVVGFGFTKQDKISPTLRKIRLPVIDTGECLRSDRAGWGQTMDEGLFCAGYLNGSAVCNGDSGGGLVFQKDETWYIGGIVAFAMQRNDGRCKHDGFGGFTRVLKYMEWIQNVTGMEPPTDIARTTNITVFNYLPTDCGRRTNESKFPWMARIYIKPNEIEHWVSSFEGSFISNQYIITKASTWDMLLIDRYRITYGNNLRMILSESSFSNLTYWNTTQSDIIRHPYFNDRLSINNIALVRLHPEILFNDFAQPICLPTLDVPLPAELIILANFGNYEKQAFGSRVHLNECFHKCDIKHKLVRIHSQFYTDMQFCAMEGSVGLISLFTGFPTMIGSFTHRSGEERFTQFGVHVQWCGNYVIYNNILYYIQWIHDTIKNNITQPNQDVRKPFVRF